LRSLSLVSATGGLVGVLTLQADEVKADPVDDWNTIANQVIVVNGGRGAAAVIDFSYVHIAIFDAVNAIDRRYTIFAVQPTSSPRGASREAAAAAAAYTVLKWLFPTQSELLDGAYAAYLAGLPDGRARSAGIRVGVEVGTALITLRTGDGRNATVPYIPGTGPGTYQFTPGCSAAVTPWMGQMKTFGIESGSQFRALAYALEQIFETRHIGVTLSSSSVPNVQALASQFFATTDDLVANVIAARIYGGMHYRTSGRDGAVIAARWRATSRGTTSYGSTTISAGTATTTDGATIAAPTPVLTALIVESGRRRGSAWSRVSDVV
jgi:hypothetical protein